MDKIVPPSESWQLGEDSEDSDVIDMEGLFCRVKRENNNSFLRAECQAWFHILYMSYLILTMT